jgi:hypothetical protein
MQEVELSMKTPEEETEEAVIQDPFAHFPVHYLVYIPLVLRMMMMRQMSYSLLS